MLTKGEGIGTLRVDLLVVLERRRRDGRDALDLQMEVALGTFRPQLRPRQLRQVLRRGTVLLEVAVPAAVVLDARRIFRRAFARVRRPVPGEVPEGHEDCLLPGATAEREGRLEGPEGRVAARALGVLGRERYFKSFECWCG